MRASTPMATSRYLVTLLVVVCASQLATADRAPRTLRMRTRVAQNPPPDDPKTDPAPDSPKTDGDTQAPDVNPPATEPSAPPAPPPSAQERDLTDAELLK